MEFGSSADVRKWRSQTSRVWTAVSDRARFLGFVSSILVRVWCDVIRIRKFYPDAPARLHWTRENWGTHLYLSLTAPFQIPVSSISVSGDLHLREIEAFNSGESAVVDFFGGPGVLLSESHRQVATPQLLEADPRDFVILVNLLKNERGRGGTVEVADGTHRLAIASIAGLETINVKFVSEAQKKYFRGTWSKNLWAWFFLPFQ